MSDWAYKPNDQRNFVHKRIIGGFGGFLTGGPAGAIAGFVEGGKKRKGGQPAAGGPVARRADFPDQASFLDARRRGVQCPSGQVRMAGLCVDTSLAGGGPSALSVQAGGVGEPVMGQFGAALQPMVEDRMVRSCLPGMVLGKDGLCYNKRDISNKQRAHPRGTKPLGTPGEMAALRKAAAFGRRMETTVKRMQKIGVLKKPRGGRRAPARQPKMLGPGVVQIQQE